MAQLDLVDHQRQAGVGNCQIKWGGILLVQQRAAQHDDQDLFHQRFDNAFAANAGSDHFGEDATEDGSEQDVLRFIDQRLLQAFEIAQPMPGAGRNDGSGDDQIANCRGGLVSVGSFGRYNIAGSLVTALAPQERRQLTGNERDHAWGECNFPIAPHQRAFAFQHIQDSELMVR